MMIDDPVRDALHGAHAHLAQRCGAAARYRPDVCPFAAAPRTAGEADDLAHLLGAGGTATVRALELTVFPGWEKVWELPGVAMVHEGPTKQDPDAVVLGPPDVPEMLDLVARTKPGPFEEHTITMGRYLGFRVNGALVAMAGERMRPPGGTEISAVCTDPAHRGRGLATRLVLAVADGIRERGETPFLHTGAANAPAVRLYEQLGFSPAAWPSFVTLRTPEMPERESRATTTALGDT